MNDDLAALTPMQLQHLHDAHNPVGATDQVTAELRRLRQREAELRETLDAARRNFQQDIAFPNFMPEDTRAALQHSAETRLSHTEDSVRRELIALSRRAASISKQLREAAAQPSLSSLDASVLDRAIAYAALLATELANADLATILTRLKAAYLRGEKAESLALMTVVRPLLHARREALAENADVTALWAIEDALSALSTAFADHSLDSLIDEAQAASKSFMRLDANILRAKQARDHADTHDRPPRAER